MAFTLANEGYDVWMGNNRGNSYSRNHVRLSTSQKEFWDFDFEQMGLYDIPAFFDYILENNDADKVAAYIGHSEGTTQFFIGSSLKPEYFEEKVNLFIALAPVTRLHNSTNSLMVYASQIWPQLQDLI